jgi:RNA methyltransferase, TrmH family
VKSITSRQHPIVARFRAAAAGRPQRPGETVLDGPHLVRDALAANVLLAVVATTPDAHETGEIAALLGVAAHRAIEVLLVSAPVMEAISPVRTPSGIVAIGQPEPASVAEAMTGRCPLVVGISGVQDPGNVGAIIRAADAAGATGVLVAAGSADPFGWKALRGAMGSTFRIPVAAQVDLAMAISTARASGIRALATVPAGGTSLYACDLTVPTLLLAGGEGPGLGARVIADADACVQIPMAPGVESLNVAVASGVCLFEAARQRAARLAAVKR